MFKRSRLITLLCIVILGIVAMLSITLISLLPTVSGGSEGKLVFTSESLSATYDGNSLSADGWEMTDGELKSGHVAVVSVKGTQKNVGTSENYFTVKIKDENGSDVTDEYSIECKPGTLTVNPAVVTITSASDAKVHDGTPLTNENYTVLPSYAIPPKHELKVEVTGSISEIGETPNTVSSVRIYNQNGKDISYNFDIIVVEGVLVVAKDAASLPGGGGSDVDTDALLGGLAGIAGGLGGVDTSGKLGSEGLGGTGAGDEGIAYILNTDRAGKIYLKVLSHGDYSGQAWGQAEPYYMLIDGTHAASYLTALALANSGATPYNVSIKIRNGQLAMPYYATEDMSGLVQLSDTYVGGEFSDTVSYVFYNQSYSSAALPAEYDSYERAYRQFVYENYLEIDPTTYSYMQGIINSEGFSRNSASIIEDVASYISGAAKYNLDYDKSLDSNPNIAISFLENYKEGICQHYATAATLLYRALGIPARYTVGFVGNAMASVDCQINNKNAHAWVEVYVDGIGWVISEVTGAGYYGGGSGSGSSGGSSEIDPGVKEPDKSISVMPMLRDKLYDGAPLTSDGILQIRDSKNGMNHQEFSNRGYRYEAVVTGERTEPGKGQSVIESIRIYDKDDNDVTDEFEIEKVPGVLHVYVSELTFSSNGWSKPYDGTPLTGVDGDVSFDGGEMADGHSFVTSVSDKSTITNAGKTANHFEVTIYDAYGSDVTDIYKITRQPGMLIVTPREIIITAGSAEKVYDGTPLVCDEAYITGGSLADGESILRYVVEGSQTNRGKHENIVKQVFIVDAVGNDVTANYHITFVAGQLTVRGK